MKGFNIGRKRWTQPGQRGRRLMHKAWNKNLYEKLIDKKPVAVAHAVKLHHAALVIDGLVGFRAALFTAS